MAPKSERQFVKKITHASDACMRKFIWMSFACVRLFCGPWFYFQHGVHRV